MSKRIAGDANAVSNPKCSLNRTKKGFIKAKPQNVIKMKDCLLA